MARTLFEREYTLLRSLRHPRIIEVFEYGLDADGPFYTMELLDGCDLRDLAPTDALTACRYLRDIASSLALLHARRLLHRDVSPRNARMQPDGSCKLLDFGALVSFGASDQIVGTPPGIAPEAVSGQALDQRTDLYSLGALGYFLLTGRHAYPARSVQALPDVWANQVVPPTFYAPDTPIELEALILQLLSLDMLCRPSTATEVIDRINAIASFEPDLDAQIARAYVRSTPLIERAPEIARADRAVARAMRGRGRTWVISASAGLGKTRLLHEVALRAQIAGMLVLHVDAADHLERLGTARALLSQLLRLHPQLGADVLSSRVAELTEAWPDLFQAPSTSTSTASSGISEERWAQLPRVIEERLVVLGRRRPLMLAIDNVPAADNHSAAVVMALARRARQAGLFVVATAHAPHADNSLALRGLYEAASAVQLKGLSAEGTQLLLQAAFGDLPHAQRTARRLHQAAQGNPEHSLMLLERWVSDGLVQYVGGGFSLPLTIPPAALRSHDQVANERLATCSDAARTIACAVAQFSHPVSIETCIGIQAAAGQLDTLTIHGALDELLRSEILVQHAQSLRFSTEQLRALADRGLEPAKRALLLGHIATFLVDTSDGSFDQQALAGLQLVRAGQRERGARWIACAARDALDAEVATHHLARQRTALELALEVYREQHKTAIEQLDLLVPLVMASYEISYAFALHHADVTLRALEDSLGTRQLRERPATASLEALLQALSAAPVLEPGYDRTVTTPDVVKLINWLVRSVASLVAAAAAAIDHEAQARFLEPLGPFRLFGPTNAAALVYEFCRLLLSMSEDRLNESHTGWTELLARVEHSGEALPKNVRDALRLGATFSLALLESQLDDARALARFAALESIQSPRTQALIAQLGFLFYGFRGEIDKSDEWRQRLEAHAVQHGSAWQVEVWANCTATAVYGNTRDLAGNKRALVQLDRLRRQMPSLDQYWERAAGMQQLLAGAPARAAEILEQTLARSGPRERVGWSSVRGALASAYNDMGQHARALKLCEETIHLSADDRDYVAMTLRVQVEHCKALGGMGLHDAAQRQLVELFERFLPNGNPLTLGVLHRTAAELALQRNDILDFEHHLNLMSGRYAATRNPALIAQADRLRNLHASALSSPEPSHEHSAGAMPETDTSVTGSVTYGTLDREHRTLELVAAQTGATSAFLFTRGQSGDPVLLSSVGEQDAGHPLLQAVRAMFEAMPADSDETAVARATPTIAAGPRHAHKLLPLAVVIEGKRMLIGAIAVRGGRHPRPVSSALLHELARQLYRAGDTICPRALE